MFTAYNTQHICRKFTECTITQNAQTPKRKVRKLTSTANPMPTPPHTPVEQIECKTKLGAAHTKLFGNNDKDTLELDKARHTSRPSSKVLKTKFQEMESRMSTKVLQLYTTYKKSVLGK